ncbi:MAG: hypothetical protein AAB676_13160 [Verrucomicrobiota bacterium]
MLDHFQCDVFLSHNQADKPRVRRLAERLRAAGGRAAGGGRQGCASGARKEPSGQGK